MPESRSRTINLFRGGKEELSRKRRQHNVCKKPCQREEFWVPQSTIVGIDFGSSRARKRAIFIDGDYNGEYNRINPKTKQKGKFGIFCSSLNSRFNFVLSASNRINLEIDIGICRGTCQSNQLFVNAELIRQPKHSNHVSVKTLIKLEKA